jgi:hypothetical protein
MNTSLKTILAATAIAVLGSPLMAQTPGPEQQAPKVEDCIHIPFPSCGDSPLPAKPQAENRSETDIANAYGAARIYLAQAEGQAPTPDQKGPNVRDCEHIPFPQCGDSPLPGRG